MYLNMNHLSVSVHLQNKIYVQMGNSATGKTYIFSLIKQFCLVNNMICCSYDYNCKDINDIIYEIKNKKALNIILFDNADLYLTQQLADFLATLNVPIVLNSRLKYKFFNTSDLICLHTKYTDNSIIMEDY